jgi:dienelactone hydrolase
METQGYQLARWLNARGIAAFVLKYRLVPTPKETSKFLELITKESGTSLEGAVSAKAAADAAAAATQDGLDAVAYLRSHAAQWHLRRDRIGLLGFSSGAFTSINVLLAADGNNRPDLVGLAYGALADWDERIPASAPPAFIAAGSCPGTWCTSREFWFGWTRAQRTTADSRAG